MYCLNVVLQTFLTDEHFLVFVAGVAGHHGNILLLGGNEGGNGQVLSVGQHETKDPVGPLLDQGHLYIGSVPRFLLLLSFLGLGPPADLCGL